MTTVVLYAFDTMADWEYGHLVGTLAQLRGAGLPVDLIVAGDSTAEVTTLGGLTLRPEYTLSDLDPAHIDMLVLPGGETWDARHDAILGLAAELEVSTVVTLGALLSDIPHTRPVPVTGATSDAALGAELGLEPSTYEGPTGIVGVLQDACARFGISSVSLWAAVPHYVAQPPCPKATLALVRRIEDILDIPVPLGDLVEEARAWEIGVDELASEDHSVF